ncbi:MULTISPECIES: MBL fold metallo-hydrolase [unclassified Sedimentibacter]|uniref:MBL fold metallo-hydrolase n=1 Tax=unclassified Sedimentibacter TaxID=2649220 RepID=UPI0027DED498|nr:MBL fold metallo-hydrolase [Sedimentibacter sp. MB35-C1]WMJ77673.1 MBL fold metallo-hydrolase [Sedimentibacter sp. MB35-C1]
MEIIHVKGGTYCIDLEEAYVPFYKINDRDIVLMDTGYIDDRDRLESVIEKHDFNLKGIITSHCHPDHIANNQYFKEKYNCIIAAPEFEAHLCSSFINLKSLCSLITLAEIKEQYWYMFFETDVYISDKQESINFCGVDFKIMHIPGHSSAQICIITPDNVGYVADALVSYELIEYTKITYGYILTEDLKSKLKLLDLKCDKYVVAHKGIYDEITNLTADNIEFYKRRAEKIYEGIKGRMTMEEITKAASSSFGIKLSNIYKYDLVSRMIGSYVDYLDETGKIRAVIDDGFRKYERNE